MSTTVSSAVGAVLVLVEAPLICMPHWTVCNMDSMVWCAVPWVCRQPSPAEEAVPRDEYEDGGQVEHIGSTPQQGLRMLGCAHRFGAGEIFLNPQTRQIKQVNGNKRLVLQVALP